MLLQHTARVHREGVSSRQTDKSSCCLSLACRLGLPCCCCCCFPCRLAQAIENVTHSCLILTRISDSFVKSLSWVACCRGHTRSHAALSCCYPCLPDQGAVMGSALAQRLAASRLGYRGLLPGCKAVALHPRCSSAAAYVCSHLEHVIAHSLDSHLRPVTAIINVPA